MKLKIYIFICVYSSLLLLIASLKLKHQRLEQEKLYAEENLKKGLNFREKDWGGILEAIPDPIQQAKDNIENKNKELSNDNTPNGTKDKAAEGNLPSTPDSEQKPKSNILDKLDENKKAETLTGDDKPGDKGKADTGIAKEANKTATKVKDAIDCAFGKCKEGEGSDKLNITDNNGLISNGTVGAKNNTAAIQDIINDANNPSTAVNKTSPSSGNQASGIGDRKHVINEITLNKRKIQSQIDPRYILIREQDEFMNSDNTIRFIASDTTDMESYSLKLFFKGNPSEGVFFSQNNDPTFVGSINDCKNNKIINNRLYNKPATNALPINDKFDKPIFSDINLPRCLTVADNGNLKSDYLNIFTLPEGLRLDRKCLKEEEIDKHNSCFPHLRAISSGVLHALKIFNMGTTFFKHGNIFPHNLYLLRRNDTYRIFLDNMIFDNNKYDDISQKPFKQDMNMLGDTLIHILTGTKNTLINYKIKGAFDIYHEVKKYFKEKDLDLNIYSPSLNMGSNFKESMGKCITIAEYEFMLKKTIFNFIHRLKCSGSDPAYQFMDIDQALKHEFLSNGSKDLNLSDKWGSVPSDY